MQNVCKQVILALLLILPSAVFADSSVTSIEQLEEKMENVTLCSEGNKESCSRFNCLETCLNLSEDPIDCSTTCYFEVNAKKPPTCPVAVRH